MHPFSKSSLESLRLVAEEGGEVVLADEVVDEAEAGVKSFEYICSP